MLYVLTLCFLLPLTIFTAVARPPPYTATDYILLNCGAPSNLTDGSGRSWNADARSKYAPPNAPSSPLEASVQHPSVNQVPYSTARVFESSFTYTFPVLSGPKFLRLYFYPTTYSTFDTRQSFFSVTAKNFTLLSNFSAFLNTRSSSNPSFMKEFLINVEQNQRLVLMFSPKPNSFAFINGIEIVSLPDTLYFRGNDVPIVFYNQLFYLKNDTAMESLYRLNIGGSNIEIQDDSGPNGMFRAWHDDVEYITGTDFSFTPHADDVQIKYTLKTPPYSAPERVYTTSRTIGNDSNRLDWAFSVDSGFYYLLRFHFCEIQLEVTKQNQRVFTVQVNNQTEELEADVIYWTGGNEIPIWRDYITWIPDNGSRGKKNMSISLFPNMEGQPLYASALLNGLEIFKLNDSSGSLAAANPVIVHDSSSPGESVITPAKKNSKGSSVIYAVIGSVIGVLAIVATVSFLIFRRIRKVKVSEATNASKWVPLSSTSRSTTRTNGSNIQLPSDLCRHFLLEEMKSATNNFDDGFVIGRGGFGNVYKGYIDDSATPVAIKRLNSSSNQGVREFLTEIDMLSKLRHTHLVSLLGYCNENGEMILVYDYMAHGTLREHLYNSENTPLNWKQRLQICIGAAKGLHYLHTSTKQTIIHRDVKSTNILLDEKWDAKVSDFGLSRVGPTGGADTHVSTTVKGSFGYVDPEYYRRQQLTDKSDVYSFGVVLFEVLCGRPAVIRSLPKEQVNLAEWAKLCCRKGTLEQSIDRNLHDKIAPECLSKFVEIAMMCVRDRGIERPTMSDVVWSLEFAMQLQEAAEKRGGGILPRNLSLPLTMNGGEANTTDDEDMFSGSSEAASRSKSSGLSISNMSDKLNSGVVFSQMLNPLGR